jgi:uncharacterized membrane protein
MYLLSGVLSLLASFVMFFVIQVISLISPHEIVSDTGGSHSAYAGSILWWPLLALVMGIVFIIIHLRRRAYRVQQEKE